MTPRPPGGERGIALVAVMSASALVLALGLSLALTTTIEVGIVPAVMDLEYEPETTHLWAVCDNTCDGRIAALDIAGNGRFAATGVFERPAGMLNYNNEGFTLAPQAECVGGAKPAFWTDDTAVGGHVLRSGTFNCTMPDPVAPLPTATATADASPTRWPRPRRSRQWLRRRPPPRQWTAPRRSSGSR